MPNNSWIRSETSGYGTEPVIEDRLVWYVPVDDEHTILISTSVAHLSGTAADEFAARRKEIESVDASTLLTEAEAVLAGRTTIEELGTRLSIYQQTYVEDYVTMVGQGIIADRGVEHPSRSDEQIMRKRKTLEREIRVYLACERMMESGFW
jgi:hypothetical protein